MARDISNNPKSERQACDISGGTHHCRSADRAGKRSLPWPWIDPDKALPWVRKHIGLALAESQVAAVSLALMSKVTVMTGGPGVGKTTIVKAILRTSPARAEEGGRSSASGCGQNRLSHDSSTWRVHHGRGGLSGQVRPWGPMVSSRPGRWASAVGGRTVAMKYCFSARANCAGRVAPDTKSSSDTTTTGSRVLTSNAYFYT